MTFNKQKDESMKWYATEILNTNDENYLIWQILVPMGGNNYTPPYRELQKPVFVKVKNF
jgi:hypothetical protein